MTYLTAPSIRHMMSVLATVVIAVFVNAYFSLSKEYWIVIAAFLMSQTTRGLPLRQSLISSLVIVSAMIIGSYLLIYMSQPVVMGVLIAASLICCYLVYRNKVQLNKSYSRELVFFIVLLIAVLSPSATPQMIAYRFIDILVGVLLGIIGSRIIFPINIEQAFRQGVLPILSALIDYSSTLAPVFLHHSDATDLLDSKKIDIEKSLLTQQGMYPEWVYEAGFNPGLRAGFRFFLINLERVTELFFSMHYLATIKVDAILLQDVAGRLAYTMQRNEELLAILITYFKQNELTIPAADFSSDLTELDLAMQRITPANLELLELAPDCLTLVAFTRDIKDLRGVLLRLVMALPSVAPKSAAVFAADSTR